jgi:hypothetical protein
MIDRLTVTLLGRPASHMPYDSSQPTRLWTSYERSLSPTSPRCRNSNCGVVVQETSPLQSCVLGHSSIRITLFIPPELCLRMQIWSPRCRFHRFEAFSMDTTTRGRVPVHVLKTTPDSSRGCYSCMQLRRHTKLVQRSYSSFDRLRTTSQLGTRPLIAILHRYCALCLFHGFLHLVNMPSAIERSAVEGWLS